MKALIQYILTNVLNSGATKTVQRSVINHLADNEKLQRFVVSTNKMVLENKKKAIKKVQESETFNTMSDTSPTKFFKDFSKYYKEEIQKEFRIGKGTKSDHTKKE